MAFVRSEADDIASDLWPEEYRQAICLRVNGRKLAGWERFPTSLHEMAGWATLIKDRDNANENRNNILVYKNSPLHSPGTFYPISVRLFGFLQSFQLGSHGNWQRIDHGNGHATEKVVLSCGGDIYDSAWKNQLDSLNLAGNFASKCLQMPLHRRYNSKRLFLQRRIFTAERSCSTASDVPSTAIPTQASYRSDMQAIDDECSVFHMDARGNVSSLREDSLNHGDFVEIDVEFDLVIARDNDRQTTLKAYLSFKDVVRLVPASDPSVYVATKRKPSGADHPSSTLIKRMRTGSTGQDTSPRCSTAKSQLAQKSTEQSSRK